jgi:hypothetical protein
MQERKKTPKGVTNDDYIDVEWSCSNDTVEKKSERDSFYIYRRRHDQRKV